MVKVLDTVIPDVAKQLLDLFGTAAVVRLVSTTAYDPETMTATPVPVDVAVNLVLQQKRSERGRGQLSHAEAAVSTVLFSPLEPLPRAPTLGDRLVFGGEEHELLDLEPIYSGDLVAVWRGRIAR